MRAPPPRIWLPWGLLVGLAFLGTVQGLKASSLVLAKLKGRSPLETTPSARIPDNDELAVSLSESELLDQVLSNMGSNNSLANNTDDNSTKSPLTGIPQIDYILDPNLPRELNGYNLTDYPFYDRLPDGMDFKCDGLHDGFYASVPHKCQVYHHCLFGTRYDFLCANYTAFDQKTFICHFVSEVDCVNSPKYFKRNEALYKAATTTTVAPPSTAAPVRRKVVAAVAPEAPAGRRRRPPARSRRPPAYDDAYDDEYYDDEYYDDDADVPSTGGRRGVKSKSRPSGAGDSGSDASDPSETIKSKPSPSVYERPRIPPKIRRPVPLNEREKYDYRSPSAPGDDSRPSTTIAPTSTTTNSPKSTSTTPVSHSEEEYEDSIEYSPRNRHKDYYPPTASDERDFVRRPPSTGSGRPLRRNRGPPARRRPPPPPPPDDFYDDYEDEPPPPPRRRKPYRPQRRPPYRGGGSREAFRGGGYYDEYDDRGVYSRPKYRHEEDYDAAPPPRRGYKRPPVRYESEYDDDEYYDDEEEEETPVYSRRRPQSSVSRQSTTSSPRSRTEDRNHQRRNEGVTTTTTTTAPTTTTTKRPETTTRQPFKPNTTTRTLTTTTTIPPPPPPAAPSQSSSRFNNFFRPSAPAALSPVDVELKPTRMKEIRPSEALIPIGGYHHQHRVTEFDPKSSFNKYNYRPTTPEPRVTSYRPSGPESLNLYRTTDLKTPLYQSQPAYQTELRTHFNRQPMMELNSAAAAPSQPPSPHWPSRNGNFADKNRAQDNVVPPDDDDLEEEDEYDVTLNDALQPTLHPARRNVQGVAVAGALPLRQVHLESGEETATTLQGRIRRIQRVQRKREDSLSGY